MRRKNCVYDFLLFASSDFPSQKSFRTIKSMAIGQRLKMAKMKTKRVLPSPELQQNTKKIRSWRIHGTTMNEVVASRHPTSPSSWYWIARRKSEPISERYNDVEKRIETWKVMNVHIPCASTQLLVPSLIR